MDLQHKACVAMGKLSFRFSVVKLICPGSKVLFSCFVKHLMKLGLAAFKLLKSYLEKLFKSK